MIVESESSNQSERGMKRANTDLSREDLAARKIVRLLANEGLTISQAKFTLVLAKNLIIDQARSLYEGVALAPPLGAPTP